MNKPLIAVDLDGTLIDTSGHYSLETRDYFRGLSAKGCVIVLSSGRPYRAMRHIYEDLNLTGPVICYNGQLIFNPHDESFHPVDQRFPKEKIRAICKELKPYVHSFMAESGDKMFVNRVDERLRYYFPYEGTELHIGDLDETLDEDVYTCLFRTFEPELDIFLNAVEKHPGIAWRSWSNETFSELYIPGCDKGSALATVMRCLGIPREDVYAFGDAQNDVSMLELAGHPFAMKGGRVPDQMGRFTETKNPVEEDGVMRTLQEVLSL